MSDCVCVSVSMIASVCVCDRDVVGVIIGVSRL